MPLILLFLALVSPLSARAQQSLFNVPSSEQTRQGEHFAQEQLNLLPHHDFSNNLTYDYGLAENVEVGFNVLGWDDFPESEGGNSADYMANAQYFYDIEDKWSLGFGTQLGGSEEGSFAAYGFVNLRRKIFDDDSFFVAGLFDANSAYLEEGHANWHLGFEYALIPNELTVIADYINGNSSLSEGVVGFGYYASVHWIVSAGWQIPAPNSGNEHGAVLELTYH